MERIKFILRAMVFVIAGLFLHYVLPQHDVVKLTSTEIIRTDFGGFNRIFYAQADSGAVDQPTRDLRQAWQNAVGASPAGLAHGAPRINAEPQPYHGCGRCPARDILPPKWLLTVRDPDIFDLGGGSKIIFGCRRAMW